MKDINSVNSEEGFRQLEKARKILKDPKASSAEKNKARILIWGWTDKKKDDQ